jgi:hypothetical protein
VPNLAEERVRFSFRSTRRKGSFSLKTFKKCSLGDRKLNCATLREYARMSVLAFKSAAGPRLRKRKIRLDPPDDLSEDVKDDMWHYFRVSGRSRIFGFFLEPVFHVVAFDPDHDIK